MTNINADILQATLNDISRLLTECLTDKEIMKQLNIPKSTYYKYKATLHREAADDFRAQRLEDFALHKQLMEDRLKAILQPLIARIQQSQDPSSKISNRDLGSLAETAREIVTQINDLNVESFNVISKTNRERAQLQEGEEPKQLYYQERETRPEPAPGEGYPPDWKEPIV